MSIISFTIVLIIAESLFSYLDPEDKLPLNNVHQGQNYTWGYIVKENSFGARDKEPVIPKPKGAYRIIALGDSFTWGLGVSEGERYSDVAEKILKDKEPKFEIVNLARPGDPLTAYRDRLFKYGSTLDPDLITIGFCINDTQIKGENYYQAKSKYADNNRFLLNLFSKSSPYFPYLTKRAESAFYNLGEWRGKFPHWSTELDKAYNKESKEWRHFSKALKDIKKWSDNQKLDTPIFIILAQASSTTEPTYFSNPDPLLKTFNRWFDQVAKAASDIGFKVVDTRPQFLAELDGEILGINAIDAHPSSREHAIYGRLLAEQITKP